MELELFKEQLKNLGKRVQTLQTSIGTEEATKTSLIMPFFQILGYDIFNPLEFVPEFVADVGIKKGEKVDYAVIMNDLPVMLVEAKSITENLTKHDSQLFRYFGTTTSKFGILTNGKEYKFFTDLDETNKMDSTPFLSIDITKIRDAQIPEIAKFHKDNFDIDTIISSASELKYLNSLKNYLASQFENPDEKFIKHIANEIYDGVKTKQVLERFELIVKKGLSQFINERVSEKLSTALKTSIDTKVQTETTDMPDEPQKITENEIITTPEELEAYTTVKIILKDVVEPSRIFYRDNRSYFNILLDDNIRKWIMRVFIKNNAIKIQFNNNTKTQYDIDTPLDIINYKETLSDITSSFL